MTSDKHSFDHRYSITKGNAKQIGNTIHGGMDTARPKVAVTPEEIAAREAERADALAYMTRTGNTDLLPVLGLVHVPVVKPRKVTGTPKACAVCQATFSGSTAEQITCSRSCGAKHAARTRKPGQRKGGAA